MLSRTPFRVVLISLLLLGGCAGTGAPDGTRSDAAPAPERLQAHLNLAEGYLQQGDPSRAKLPLQRALEIDGRSWQAHDLMGRIYQREGEAELAEKHFRLAVRYDGRSSRVRNDYGVFLHEQGRHGDAVEQLRRAVADPDNPQRAVAYENLGLASLSAGLRTEARNAFARAVMLDERMARSLLELAQLAYVDADYEQSAAYYRRFRDLSRQTPASLWLGIRLARVTGNENAESSYALQLRNLYPLSDEYRQYRESREQQADGVGRESSADG
jgi:type IV pilus assembly protein PilF